MPASRRIAIVGAASSIGIRPYDDVDVARHLDDAPARLREHGLVDRLHADDLGDLTSGVYRDFTRPPGAIRNERDVIDYSLALAERVESAAADHRFVLVLGGDCSVVLGALLGIGRQSDPVGLAYIDAHADFATPQESQTGSAASMCLALAVGRGDSPLAQLHSSGPLVHGRDVALIGRRSADTRYGEPALEGAGILDMTGDYLSGHSPAAVAETALERITRPELAGFWIHVDADVIDPRVMPAVDSPEPGGPDIDELVSLVAPLVRHPRALGLELTIYDPSLDPDDSCAARLVDFLERACGAGQR